MEARNACPLGLRWFGDGSLPGAVLGGRSAAIEEVVGEIADILRLARAPLVYLAPDLTSESQRASVAIADQLHAFIDGVTSATASEGILAAQRRGRASATLGEIRNRADVLVFWAVDPALSYPRFQSRYAPNPPGVHVPNGRADRTVIAVDVGSQRGPDDADVRIQMTAEEESLFLASLRGCLAGRSLGGASILARVTELAARLNRAKYAVIVADGELPPRAVAAPATRADSLIALTQALNATTRGSLCTLRAGGNRNGADTVLTWQTGFPMAVDFARGAPTYTPEDATLSRLARGAFDAVLLVGATNVPSRRSHERSAGRSHDRDRSAREPKHNRREHSHRYRRRQHSRVGDRVSHRRHSAAAPRSAAHSPGHRLLAQGARLRDRREGGRCMTQLRITGGAIHDPANGIDGDVRDVCIDGGRIVASTSRRCSVPPRDGMVVMAGGIDIHAHVACIERQRWAAACSRRSTRSTRLARRASRWRRSRARAAAAPCPSTFTTGYRYAGLGYTTVFDAAVAPLAARQTHAEFDDTPIIDGGFFVTAGQRRVSASADRRERARPRARLCGVDSRSHRRYAIKLVNPGGIELWKRDVREVTDARRSGRLIERHPASDSRGARQCFDRARPAAPGTHPLQQPRRRRERGDDARDHACARGPPRAFHASAVSQLRRRARERRGAPRRAQVAEYVNAHPEVTGDVGQVMFGHATTLTADGAVEYLLHTSTGRKWINSDIELETGCGIVPYSYKEKAAVASLQWVVGLELFLLSADPWRVVLSTDHPNGGSFMAIRTSSGCSWTAPIATRS